MRASLVRAAAAEEEMRSAWRAQTVAVIAARADGASWAEVGEAFGISRQAAQSRFTRAIDTFHRTDMPEGDPRLYARGPR